MVVACFRLFVFDPAFETKRRTEVGGLVHRAPWWPFSRKSLDTVAAGCISPSLVRLADCCPVN